MSLLTELQGLVGKPVTVWLIGGGISGGVECAGTLAVVGDDYIDVDAGAGAAAHSTHWLVPIASIACVAHRV